MQETTFTLDLTPREMWTIETALRLFAEGSDTKKPVVLDSGKVSYGKQPGYLADYTPEEFKIFFRDSVRKINAKRQEALQARDAA